MSIENHNQKIKKVYENHLVGKDVDSPEAVFWRGKEKLDLRFKILTEIDNLEGKKILDFGCGTGLLPDYMYENQIYHGRYEGWDISSDMTTIAKKRNGRAYLTTDVINNYDSLMKDYENYFDYILISGLFFIKTDSEEDVHVMWIEELLEKLWSFCTKGIAVNFYVPIC